MDPCYSIQMNKLLREVPTMESWLNEGSSEFVQVSLHKDFIQSALVKLRKSIEHWLNEPKEFCDAIGELETLNVAFIYFYKLLYSYKILNWHNVSNLNKMYNILNNPSFADCAKLQPLCASFTNGFGFFLQS